MMITRNVTTLENVLRCLQEEHTNDTKGRPGSITQ